ncbi:1367_t:CDS:1, partial [Funneliformis mosseae]
YRENNAEKLVPLYLPLFKVYYFLLFMLTGPKDPIFWLVQFLDEVLDNSEVLM